MPAWMAPGRMMPNSDERRPGVDPRDAQPVEEEDELHQQRRPAEDPDVEAGERAGTGANRERRRARRRRPRTTPMIWLTTEIETVSQRPLRISLSGWKIWLEKTLQSKAKCCARLCVAQPARPISEKERPGRAAGLAGALERSATRRAPPMVHRLYDGLVRAGRRRRRVIAAGLDAVLREDRRIGAVVDHRDQRRLDRAARAPCDLVVRTLMPSSATSSVTPDSSNRSGFWTV